MLTKKRKTEELEEKKEMPVNTLDLYNKLSAAFKEETSDTLMKVLNNTSLNYLEKVFDEVKKTTDITKFIEVNKKALSAYIARRYMKDENLEKAIEYFKISLEFFPKQTDIYSWIGALYEKLEDFENAEKYYIEGMKNYDKGSFRELAILNYGKNPDNKESPDLYRQYLRMTDDPVKRSDEEIKILLKDKLIDKLIEKSFSVLPVELKEQVKTSLKKVDKGKRKSKKRKSKKRKSKKRRSKKKYI